MLKRWWRRFCKWRMQCNAAKAVDRMRRLDYKGTKAPLLRAKQWERRGK